MYLWDLEDEPESGKEMSFAGVVLMKKSQLTSYLKRYELITAALPSNEDSPSGAWDSLHVFECHERGRSAKYKLTSTVMLVLDTKTISKAEIKGVEMEDGKGGVKLSGSMTRQVGASSPISPSRERLTGQNEFDYPLTSASGHIPNIGRMVEDIE